MKKRLEVVGKNSDGAHKITKCDDHRKCARFTENRNN